MNIKILTKNFKINIVLFTFIIFKSSVSLAIPDSFADLVEKLIPSVVSIASTTNVKRQNNQNIPKFPEGSPFDDFF